MAGPWEKYRSQPAPADGPWTKYGSASADTPGVGGSSIPAAPAPGNNGARTDELPDNIPRPGAGMTPGYTPQTPLNRAVDDISGIGDTIARNLQIGTQGVGRGAAEAVALPINITNILANLPIQGADKLAEQFGGNVDFRFDTNFGEAISDKATEAADAVGYEVLDPQTDMSNAERYGYNINKFGTEALVSSGALAARGAQGLEGLPKVLQGLFSPYQKNAARPLLGDAMGGVGVGAADETYSQNVDAENQGWMGRLLAQLVGAMGGSTAASMGRGVAERTKNAALDARDRFAPEASPNPIDPSTGLPYKRSDLDQAALMVQGNADVGLDRMATDPARARMNIIDNAAELRRMGVPDDELPSVGMLADDTGMAAAEKTQRVRDQKPFIERDAARGRRVTEDVAGTNPGDNIDAGGMNQRMDEVAQERTAPARQRVDDLERRQGTVARAADQQATELNEAAVRQPEASRALDERYTSERIAGQQRRSAAYDSVPAETPVDSEIVADIVLEGKRGGSEFARIAKEGDQTLMGAIEPVTRRLYKRDPELDALVLRDDLTYGDLADMHTMLSGKVSEAIAMGKNPADLKRIRDGLGRVMEDVNPAAKQESARFAERFKTGQAGEYRDAQKRAIRTGNQSGATDPDNFGRKVFQSQQSVDSFGKALDMPNSPKTIKGGIDWMVGDMAKSGLSRDGRVQAGNLRSWADRNKDVIDSVPGLRSRVDAEIKRAARTGRISGALQEKIKTAQQNLRTTERGVQSGTFGRQANASPKNAVKRIMGGDNARVEMKELWSEMKTEPQKQAARKAVSDWLVDKVSTSARNLGDSESVKTSASALKKLFAEHQDTLSEVFTPEQMNALRRSHKMLELDNVSQVRGTAGSDTAANFSALQKGNAERNWRTLEAGLKAKFGVLKGGGILRTIRTAVSALPQGSRGADEIYARMWFDPELAVHLMDRPLKDVGTPNWNKQLQRILRLEDAVHSKEQDKDADNVGAQFDKIRGAVDG